MCVIRICIMNKSRVAIYTKRELVLKCACMLFYICEVFVCVCGCVCVCVCVCMCVRSSVTVI